MCKDSARATNTEPPPSFTLSVPPPLSTPPPQSRNSDTTLTPRCAPLLFFFSPSTPPPSSFLFSSSVSAFLTFFNSGDERGIFRKIRERDPLGIVWKSSDKTSRADGVKRREGALGRREEVASTRRIPKGKQDKSVCKLEQELLQAAVCIFLSVAPHAGSLTFIFYCSWRKKEKLWYSQTLLLMLPVMFPINIFGRGKSGQERWGRVVGEK